MARKRKKDSLNSGKIIAGTFLFILSLIILISLITHSSLDDARLRGDIDSRLNPFTDIQYRNQAGIAGAFFSMILTSLLGWISFFLPISLIYLSLRLFSSEITQKFEFSTLLLFMISLLGTMIYNIHLLAKQTIVSSNDYIGGYIGQKLTQISLAIVGEIGSYVVLSGIGLLLLLLYTPLSKMLSFSFKLPDMRIMLAPFRMVKNAFANALSRSSQNFEDDDSIVESKSDQLNEKYESAGKSVEKEFKSFLDEEEEKKIATRKSILKKQAEQVHVKSLEYKYPSVELLSENPNTVPSISNDELEFTARMLKETLETFDVRIEGPIEKFPGPVITRYEFKPAAGVKVNRVIGLSDDLALALKAKRIRIVAPIPGKAAIGIEIPNRNPQIVYLKKLIQSNQFNDSQFVLPLILGKTISGQTYVADLAKMPHLLIAGATGAGKSVCMNVLITSLLYRLHPLQVRFMFIDPKMLELSVYSGIPHLGRPVVTKPKRAEKVLADTVVEMERRYRHLANVGVRNIQDYNAKQKNEEDKLPYIIIFVDELADLMMSSTSSKTELLITRLAQMARAVGIHLILATQRPSVDVITGLIKANFPARIAFQVASKVDSRTILDANGAEKLLGNGDMLFMSTGQPEPIRLHGAFLSSDETDTIVSFIKEQGLPVQSLENISQDTGDVKETEIDLGDPLFREACEVVIRQKQGSVSLLQRRLGIGYQRAARLIDKLEQAGIVSNYDGSKARDVLVDQSFMESMFSDKISNSSVE